jgi:FG-GAP-like repeat/ASPIC and UnbV
VLASPPTADQANEAIRAWTSVAYLEMYQGRFAEAVPWLERAQMLSATPGLPASERGTVRALLGIIALRRGEVENCLECLGPSSCIFPIAREAVHQRQTGSREAIRHFTAYLEEWPGDLRVRWLLNLAYMTLGEYPEKVPPTYLIPPDRFRSKLDVGRFDNVAPTAGLGARGPGQAGGVLFDDFNGDGLPDLFTSSIDADRGASLFINRGDGTFEDRSGQAGLDKQVYALNLTRADYDNDGDLDVLLLRGAWETPMRMSLLRNNGAGVFDDVTIASGMGEPISTESTAWGDYDDDGLVDVFVCGEYRADPSLGPNARPDPRNRCRLYHNLGNGRFEDVAARAGVLDEEYAKGSAWGDYDGDGRIDLFVSSQGGPCRLYHNEGDGTFIDVARELGVAGPRHNQSFACWFWDFDNDGRLDLFVNDYEASLATVVAYYLGLKGENTFHPRVLRNLGDQGFRDVSKDVGVDWPITSMGANFGDIDNDGYLDVYLGTGWMSYSGLAPKLMLKNVDGRRFEDVTDSSRTGHLQKGHGVGFADYDGDGDLDVFISLGGGYPGDRGYGALFRNPGHGRHWLKVKLVGTRTNRAALGARIRVDLHGPGGAPRSIYRVVGNNGSFGGNSLVETIGLAEATTVARLTVHWPTSRTTQTFRHLAADRTIAIVEGSATGSDD